jgi:hypothetical protein
VFNKALIGELGWARAGPSTLAQPMKFRGQASWVQGTGNVVPLCAQSEDLQLWRSVVFDIAKGGWFKLTSRRDSLIEYMRLPVLRQSRAVHAYLDSLGSFLNSFLHI